MKRRLALVVLAALLGPAAASDVTDAIHAWMGKWPAEPLNRQPVATVASKDARTFWQFPGTRAGLEDAIGKRRAAVLIGRWSTGDDLKMAGPRWASFMACKPHDCGANSAQVFVDTVSGRFNVCWTEESRSAWLAPRRPALALGNDGCNADDPAKLIARYGR